MPTPSPKKRVDPFAVRPRIDPLAEIEKEGFLGFRATESPVPAGQMAELPPYLAHFQLIPIERLRPGRYQKRLLEARDEEKYVQLEAQMRDSYEHGGLRLFVPVMPDPEDEHFYNPAQGMHRRIEIAAKLGIAELPCYVESYNAEALALGTLYENMGRQDLTIVELGYVFLQMRDDFNLTQEEIARRVYREKPGGRDYVKRCVAAAQADPDIQSLIFLAPDRSVSIIGPLSRLHPESRAPLIEAFLAEKLKAEGIIQAVKEIEAGGSFSLDEGAVNQGATTPKTLDRIARAVRARKSWTSYFNEIRSAPLSHTERVELEELRRQLDDVLRR